MGKEPEFIAEGRALFARRDYANVVRICREGLVAAQKQRKSRAKNELENEARLLLAQALAALGRWRELLVETDLLIAGAPAMATVWRLRGQAMLSGEDFTGAEHCLQRAKALDPKDHAVEHLMAELAIAKSASARSFSANDLTEHAETNTEDRGGTLPTAPEIVVAPRNMSLAASPDGGTLTTSVGPLDLGGLASPEGHEVHTEIDIEVPSDPAIRVDIPGKQGLVSRTPAPAPKRKVPSDEHEETVPIPYADSLPEERTDVLPSSRIDPLLQPVLQAVLRPTGAGETTNVPPALPPPPSPPPPALEEQALSGHRTRTDLDTAAVRRRRRRLGLLLVVLIAIAAIAYLALRQRSGGAAAPVQTVPVAEVRRQLVHGSWTELQMALTQLAFSGASPLRARVTAEAAYWYGGDRPSDLEALRAIAGAQRAPASDGADQADALDALCLAALAAGDRDAARRYAAEREQRFNDARSHYLVGLALLQDGKPAEAATTLRKAASESKYPLALLAWARAEARTGRLAEARTAFAAAESAAPEILLIRAEAVRTEIRASGPASELQWLTRLEGPSNAAPGEKARAKLAEAELYIARQDVDAARRALLAAMTLKPPADATLGAELGAALASVGDLDAAEPLARRAFESGALNSRLILAEIVQRRGRFEEALTLLAGEATPEGRVARADCELGLGRPTAARSEIDAALQQSPGLVSALVVLSRIEILEGRADEARARLERLAAADPTGSAAALAGRLWIRARVLERARALVADATRLRPMSADVQLAVAELALASGDPARAKQALQLSARLAVGSPAMRQERATLAAALGDLAGAADQLATIPARAAAVEGARFRLLLGDAERAGIELDRAKTLSGAPSEAEAEARARWLLLVRPPQQIGSDVASLSLGPHAGTAKVRAKLLQSDWAQAERELVGLHPSAETTYLKARLAVDRGKSGAAAVLEKLLKQVDADQHRALRAEILALLGRLAFEKGAAAKAVNYLDEAIALYPGLAEAQLYLGLAIQERGDREGARRALEQAVRLPPHLVESEYYLGRLLATDAPQTARPHLQRYLDVAPQGPFAEDARLLLRKL